MARAYESTIIPASVDDVWTLARDFDNLPTWHPGITASVIEDGQSGGMVGCVRRLSLDDGGQVRERLLRLDDVERRYTYNFVESPFPVRSYECTLAFRPITSVAEGGHTFAEWYADFDADASNEKELVDTFSKDVFAVGLAALASRFASAG